MTLALLVKTLSKHLRSILDSYHTAQGEGSDGKGDFKKVEVFEWFIPFSDPRKKATDFPYVEVRVPKAKKERPKSLVKVEMTFGVFSQATSTADGLQRPDGAYDLVNLIEHVQTQLMRRPTIDGRFRIEQQSCEITIPDEQPYPYFIGVLETQWELPFVIDEEGAVKAYG